MASEVRFLESDIIRIPAFERDKATGMPVGERLKKIVLFWGDQVKIVGKQDDQQVVELERTRVERRKEEI